MAVVKFDRAAQVPGNIVHFEHVNVTVPDPVKATIFWIMGMGFTRDPYLMVGIDNMWANMGAPSSIVDCRGATAAKVRIGGQQLSFIFRETNDPIPAYDGHHVAIYIADFYAPYKKLMDRGLISMESHAYEWRFIKIVDPDTNELLFEIEHEVRSMTNPLYMRPLVNRNAAQQQRTYQRGRDTFYPGA